MLSRISAYLQHAGSAVLCASRLGMGAALRFGLSPWRRRELLIPIGSGAPFRIRGRTTDVAVFREVFLKGSYDVEMREPRAILDAGANIGSASVFFARRFPNARIVAVEPEDTNFGVLRRNTAPYPNVLPVKGAVWSHRTRLNLKNPHAAKVSFRVEAGNGDSGEVEAHSIADLAALGGVPHFDLLKIDIEGAEGELFRAGGAWLDQASAMFIELHDRYSVGASREVLSRLVARPFRLVTPPGSIFVEFAKAS